MNEGVILVSGGMDSLVTAAIAVEECHKIYMLHISYGQRTAEKELQCFLKIVEHYRPQRHLKVEMDFFRQIGSSSLTDSNIQVPLSGRTDTKIDKHHLPNTYVPFRNGMMLSTAAAWAETVGANRIYIGAVEEDSSGYPDCRMTFIEQMERAVNLGTAAGSILKIEAPLINKRKREIVEVGHRLKAPLKQTWSCYLNNDKACGKCDSCRLRLQAFEQAGLQDPVSYE